MRKLLAALLTFILATLPCMAQQPSPPPASQIIVPAGTPLSVVLTGQISSTATRTGTQLHFQLVSPVVSDSEVAIPAGTYLQGTVSNITQQSDRVSISLTSTTLVYPNGYVAKIPGTVLAQSAEGWWRPAPSSGSHGLALIPALLAPGIGAGIGAAVGKSGTLTPGSFGSGGQLIPGSLTPSTRGKDAAIGFGIGAGILAIGLIAYSATHHHSGPDFFYEAGAPMEIDLPSALPLDAAKVSVPSPQPPSIQPLARRPLPPAPPAADSDPFPAPTATGMCPGPDIPGTPDTVIPGTPATPDSPGTPDIVIPGMPSTPGPMVPCS